MKLPSKVVHFKLYQSISRVVTDKLFSASKDIQRSKPSLIAVSINSIEGSLIQAKNILSILQEISDKTSAPIYCFGEEMVGGAAIIVMAGAKKSFLSKHSMIGQFGFSTQFFDKSELNKRYGIESHFFNDTPKGSKLDSNTPFTDEDRKWINQMLVSRQTDLRYEFFHLRKDKFLSKGLSQKDVEDKIFSQDGLFAAEAFEKGLIDGIDTLDSVINKEYPGANIKIVQNRKPSGSSGSISEQLGISSLFSPLGSVLKSTN